MCLVYEQPIHAQLLKGHHIVLPLPVVQPLELRFQTALGLLHLLDGIITALLGFQRLDPCGDLFDLLLDHPYLTVQGQGDLLKLAVADNDGIVVACGDPAAKPPSVLALEVFLRSH